MIYLYGVFYYDERRTLRLEVLPDADSDWRGIARPVQTRYISSGEMMYTGGDGSKITSCLDFLYTW